MIDNGRAASTLLLIVLLGYKGNLIIMFVQDAIEALNLCDHPLSILIQGVFIRGGIFGTRALLILLLALRAVVVQKELFRRLFSRLMLLLLLLSKESGHILSKTEKRHLEVLSDCACVDFNHVLACDALREGTLDSDAPVLSPGMVQQILAAILVSSRIITGDAA